MENDSIESIKEVTTMEIEKACLEKKKTKCYTMKCTGKRVEKAGDYQRVDGH